MPRNLRIDYKGAVHHIVNRGQNGRNVFIEPGDRAIFLNALELACLRYGSSLHTWALMPNHFHAVMVSGNGQISETIRDAKSRYTQLINARHSWDGSLFSGRFFNRVVLDPTYLQAVLVYVTTNPERSILGRQDEWTGRQRLAQGDPLMLEAFGSFDVYEAHEKRGLRSPDDAVEQLHLLTGVPHGQITGVVGSTDRRFRQVRRGLELVARHLDCTPGELLCPTQGRRNHRAKLVTWYLVTCGDLTHAEIGRVLGIADRTVGSRAAQIDVEVQRGSDLGRTALALAGRLVPAPIIANHAASPSAGRAGING